MDLGIRYPIDPIAEFSDKNTYGNYVPSGYD